MKIVLAYSGDSTPLWPSAGCRKVQAEIVAFCSDVGQQEDLEAARSKALRCGVVACHILDQREEFVRDFVFPAVRAAALYQGEYYLGTSLAALHHARPDGGAAKEKTNTIAHGHGKGNDQVRFELGAYWFNPSVKIIAPGASGTSSPVRR